MPLQVDVTAAAARFMQRMVRYSAHPGGGFRLTVTPGGCSGYASEFSVEPAPLAGDTEVELGGVRAFLPTSSRLLLDGASLDFVETATQSGLSITHAAAAPCGCSTADAAQPPRHATVSVASIQRR